MSTTGDMKSIRNVEINPFGNILKLGHPGPYLIYIFKITYLFNGVNVIDDYIETETNASKRIDQFNAPIVL